MTAWELPTSLNVNGCDYEIRTDYRVILDILMAMNDPDILLPEMDEKEKNAERVMTMLQILYIDFDSIPVSDWKEAAEKAKEFIDCGLSEDGRYHPKIMDWKQDAAIIVPAINKVSGTDIRADKYVHWWTFMSYYLEIGDCLFSSVINIFFISEITFLFFPISVFPIKDVNFPFSSSDDKDHSRCFQEMSVF